MGLARAVSDREAAEAEAGKAYGTPYYISPEQIRGERDVDARADIYSLGATLYHMVTGQVPFDGQNPSAVMHKHLKNDLIPPDHINKGLSHGISEVIEVCLAKDRNKRYSSAALAGLSTGEAHEHQSPTLPRETLTDNPAFWMAVTGWVAALMMAIALLVAWGQLMGPTELTAGRHRPTSEPRGTGTSWTPPPRPNPLPPPRRPRADAACCWASDC